MKICSDDHLTNKWRESAQLQVAVICAQDSAHAHECSQPSRIDEIDPFQMENNSSRRKCQLFNFGLQRASFFAHHDAALAGNNGDVSSFVMLKRELHERGAYHKCGSVARMEAARRKISELLKEQPAAALLVGDLPFLRKVLKASDPGIMTHLSCRPAANSSFSLTG